MFFPEDEIIKQGEVGRQLFFLEKGTLHVYFEATIKKRKIINCLETGAMFGEISLVFDCKRTATVVSRNYATCSALNKEDFEELCKKHPNLLLDLKDQAVSAYKD